MSQNTQQPNAPNPKLWHDPDTIRFQDLYKYVGRDQIKINQTLRNLKGSAMYVGTIKSINLNSLRWYPRWLPHLQRTRRWIRHQPHFRRKW